MRKKDIKKCSRCGQMKPREEFYTQNKATGKIMYECKQCTNEAHDARTFGWRNVPEGHHWCSRCKVPKPMNDFHYNRSRKKGRSALCKLCCKERSAATYPAKREKQIAHAMSWNKRHPERYRNIQLRRSYGITLDEYNALLAKQGGVCAICGRSSVKALSVDHDASTGQIRGLLCATHNLAIGNFEHNADFLRAAAEYLDRASIQEPLRTPEPEAQALPAGAAGRYQYATKDYLAS